METSRRILGQWVARNGKSWNSKTFLCITIYLGANEHWPFLKEGLAGTKVEQPTAFRSKAKHLLREGEAKFQVGFELRAHVGTTRSQIAS